MLSMTCERSFYEGIALGLIQSDWVACIGPLPNSEHNISDFLVKIITIDNFFKKN
jgi:hypothetical protein